MCSIHACGRVGGPAKEGRTETRDQASSTRHALPSEGMERHCFLGFEAWNGRLMQPRGDAANDFQSRNIPKENPSWFFSGVQGQQF